MALFGFGSPLKKYEARVALINEKEKEFASLSDGELFAKSEALKKQVQSQKESVDDLLVDAFALVREAAKRTLGQRHYDVQLLGGLVLAGGAIAEMATGEGKTLAATAPTYARALAGKGVHVITVNDYLAQRDAVWMGQIYAFLGMSVACIVHDSAYMYDPSWQIKEDGEQLIDAERDLTGSFRIQKEYLRPVSRKEAYNADILYGTNHEFGFDYLRDNLSYSRDQQVQRPHYFAIIDEVDSILIDEARTPLIVSAPDQQAAEHYKAFANVVTHLSVDTDYVVDEKARSVSINDEGIEKVQKLLGMENLYDPSNIRLVHYLEESLRAKGLFFKDRHYVVKNGEIIIVDEFTGRLMPGRRFSGGLHQALEAKEHVAVQHESKTFAQITIQNYFRLYEGFSGMTGTALTSAEEFSKVYGLSVLQIPTHKPRIRKDHSDRIFKTKEGKYRALVREVKERSEHGQPLLVGTTSIDENEVLSARFSEAGIAHEVLNAKNHEREGEIIAQAGRAGSVTLATNLAGRGIDIILGGNPPDQKLADDVRRVGGLCVVGTQRHEARRVDNQLRGRAGRQGDPGESIFFLSLEDDLMRIFGGERVQSMMTRFNMPEDEPLESSLVVKIVNEAQKKVEGINFDIRKHLLEYDTVLNKQRQTVYKRRQNLLERMEAGGVADVLGELFSNVFEHFAKQAAQPVVVEQGKAPFDVRAHVRAWFVSVGLAKDSESVLDSDIDEALEGAIPSNIQSHIEELSDNPNTKFAIIGSLDVFWTNHLETLEALLESVRIRAYGQKDPLVEYKREGFELFRNLIAGAEELALSRVLSLLKQQGEVAQVVPQSVQGGNDADTSHAKIGRNDPCWCGSGKKYKKCHGK